MKKIGLNLKKIIKLNNTYIIKKKDLNELLNQIDSFESKMKLFLEKHSNMEYTLEIKDKQEDEWIVEINIKIKNEQSNTEVSEEITKSRSVL